MTGTIDWSTININFPRSSLNCSDEDKPPCVNNNNPSNAVFNESEVVTVVNDPKPIRLHNISHPGPATGHNYQDFINF